jgi:uncharacterized MAPEG superfamily protein
MAIELRLLSASVVLGLVHLIASSHLITWQRGYRWTASDRETDVPPLSGLANRVDQATTNFLAHVTNHHGQHAFFVRLLARACRHPRKRRGGYRVASQIWRGW